MASSTAATFIAFRSIVKRQMITLTSTTYSPQRLQSLPYCQTLASTTALQGRRTSRTLFTSNRLSEQKHLSQSIPASSDGKASKRHTARKAATNNSLRKVAIEAQRSRGDLLIRGSGKLRHVDPDADTKDVTAYCAAESYDLSRARRDLLREGFPADPCGTGLFPQVLHVQTPNFIIRDPETGQDKAEGPGDVFVFPSGCVVTWNVAERLALNMVERLLVPAAGDTGHVDRMEVEDLDYLEDPSKENSRIIGDTIILGTRVSSSSDHSIPNSNPASQQSPAPSAEVAITDPTTPVAGTSSPSPHPEVDTILAKIACSSALARSTKLAVLENSLAAYFDTTRAIPTTLSSGQPLRFTRSQILRKTGELLSLRAQLNLYAELTDALPDLFWDSPHELGLEGCYEMVGAALDVGVRITALNEKMDYASEIAAVLRERLSEKHSTGLEWMIIGLICIEVLFGIVHLWREGEREGEERRTREMWERWLARELRKES